MRFFNQIKPLWHLYVNSQVQAFFQWAYFRQYVQGVSASRFLWEATFLKVTFTKPAKYPHSLIHYKASVAAQSSHDCCILIHLLKLFKNKLGKDQPLQHSCAFFSQLIYIHFGILHHFSGSSLFHPVLDICSYIPSCKKHCWAQQ